MLPIIYSMLFFILLAMVITGVILMARAWFQPQKENLAQLKVDFERVRGQLFESSQQETKLKAQMMELKRDLESSQSNVLTALANESAARKKIDEIKANSREEEYRNQIDTLEKTLSGIRAQSQIEVQNAYDVISQLRHEMQTTKADNETWRVRLSQTEESSLRVKEQLTEQQAVADQQLDQLKHENLMLRTKLEDTSALETLKSELLIARQSLEDALVQSKKSNDELLQEKQSWQIKLDQLRQEVLLAQHERQEISVRMTAAFDQLSREKNALNQDKEKNINEILNLKKELDTLKTDSALQLSKAIESLKENLALSQKKTAEMSQEIWQKDLQIQSLEKKVLNNEPLLLAQRSVDDLKLQNEFFKKEIQEKLTHLQQLESELLALKNKETQKIQDLQSSLDTMTIDKSALVLAKEELEKNIQKLSEFNATLLEKEKMFQYESSKHRAQALGLERINEDYRLEIENNSKQISEIKTDNRALSQKLEETQRYLRNIEQTNSELIKKEKTTQSELMRSREQLQHLERVYAEFRTKIERIEPNPSERKEPIEGV